jgi:hypothetical protein
MLATAGLDSVVKIWDTRMLKEEDEVSRLLKPLHVMEHDKALNSIRFRSVQQ